MSAPNASGFKAKDFDERLSSTVDQLLKGNTTMRNTSESPKHKKDGQSKTAVARLTKENLSKAFDVKGEERDNPF